MNNKGFTVVELLTSFTLTMIIMVFLFEIVLQVKDVYVDNALRAKILDKNAIVATNLNNKLTNLKELKNNDIIYIECADNSCDAVKKNGNIYSVINNYICIGKKNGTECNYASGDDSTKKSIIIDGQTISVPEGTEIKSYEIKRPVVFGKYDVNTLDGSVTFASLNGDNNYVKISYTVTGDDLTNAITFNYLYSYRYKYNCVIEGTSVYCEDDVS